jgi:AcrR family transcriptional regulator
MNSKKEVQIGSRRRTLDSKKIIEVARQLYLEKETFSMRDVAEKFDTGASSLYRHFNNKRELWFSIVTKDFELFGKEMEEQIERNHRGSYTELLIKIGHFFLEFSQRDFQRFKLMFLLEPPKKSSKTAKTHCEDNCNPVTFTRLVDLTKLVMKERNIENVDPFILANTFFALVLGAAIIISPINDYLFGDIFRTDNALEEYKKHIVEISVLKLLENLD